MEETSSKRAPDRWPDDGHFFQTASSLERAGRVEELIRLLEARVRELPIGSEAARLLMRAGELARDRLRDADRAENCFRRALLYAPGAKEPFKALSIHFDHKQDYGALAELFETMAGSASGPERAAHLLRAADLYEKLQRKDRAVFCCQQASRADPSARQAFRKCRQLLLSEHRYRPAFDSLGRERAALGSAGLADDYAMLAEQLADDPLEHPLAQSAARIALEIQPGHARAEKAQRAVKVFDLSWRDRVRRLRTASLEERDRKNAARLSLLVAKLFAWCDGGARGKVKEALDRSFLLWPGMPAALDFLERMAAKENDVPGAIRSVQAMAREAKDRAVQSQLWTRAGLWRLQLDDRAGALEDFEMAAEADPSRPEGIGLAAELLIDKGRAEQALSLYERHLATLKDRRAEVDLRMWLAELGATMGRPGVGAHWEAVLKSDRTNTRAARRLAQLAIDAADAEALKPVLELALVGAAAPSDRIALALAAARLFEERGDPQSALSVLGRMSLAHPQDEQLASALAAIAQRQGPSREIGSWLQRDAQATLEPAATPLRRALADLLQRPDGDSIVPNGSPFTANGHATAGPTLEDLQRSANALISSSRWEEAAKGIETLLGALGSDQGARTGWTVKLAQVYADRLSQPDRAVDLLLALLKSDPSPEVLVALEQLASRGIRPGEISGALARHHELAGDRQRQAAALLVGLSAAKEAPVQKQLLQTLAAIHEGHLADARGAFDFIVRAMRIEPLDAAVRSEAIRLARDLSCQADLARAMATCAAQCGEPGGALELLGASADLADEAGAADDAASALKAALERSADDPAILARLADLYQKSGRFSECSEVLQRRLARAEGGEKARAYLQLANVSVELSRPAEAAQALRSAIEAGAEQARYLPWLCELLEQAGRMSELSAALGRAIELANAAGDKDEAARLSLKRAKVSEASSSDRAEAVRSYADILQRRPSDPDALVALESLLSDADCREEAARALVPAYQALREHRKLVAALDVVAQCAEDKLERVLALKQAAHIYQRQLREPGLAFAAMARALRLSPADAALRAAARQVAEGADLLDGLAEVLEQILREDAGPASIALHRELAELYEKKLEDSHAAARHLTRALELEPADVDVLRALRRLQRGAEEWPALARILETLAALAPDLEEKIALWRELATLREQKLNDVEGAASAWRQLSALDPRDRDAVIALQRLYAGLDRPEDLAHALKLRMSQEGQGPQGLEAAARLAQLRRGLGDGSAALQLYQQILRADPGHAGSRAALESWIGLGEADGATALEILDPLLAVAGDHPRRVALREQRMEAASPEEKRRLAAEIRAIYQREMRQPDLAFRAALKAFAAGIDREAARQEMERLARATGAYDDLADAYESAAESLPAADEAVVPLLRRGAQLREHLGQAEAAGRLWRQLLEQAPKDREALEHLSEGLERAKDARGAAELLARRADLAEAAEERQRLLLKAGAAFETAGADAAAIDAFRSAMAIGQSPPALEGLDRLYGRGQRAAEQAEVLEQLAAIAGDPPARRAYLARRAELLEQGRPPEALRAYQQLLELSPEDGGAVAGLERLLSVEPCRVEAAGLLEPIYRQLKDLKKLAGALEVRLGAASEGDRRAAIEELASVRELLGQKSEALQARIRAFREEPRNEAAREALERLAAETGSFDELASAYEEQLARPIAEPLAALLWRRLASLYGDRLGRVEPAIRSWEEVLAREPNDAQVLENLARLQRQCGALGPLAAVMKRQIELEPSAQKQVSILFELGRLAEEGLSDRALAAWAYQQILEREPQEANASRLLEQVLSQAERWQDLAALIGRQIQLAEQRSAAEESLEHRVRLGRLKLSRLGDPPGALEIFLEVLRAQPAHGGAVAALEEMAASEGPLRAEAAAALEPLLAAAGEHLRLVQMLEALAAAAPAPPQRVALLRKVAEVYAGPMKNPEMAFVAAARALRELPDDEVSISLCSRLVEPAEAAEDLAALLEEIAGKAADDKARASLYRTLAQLRQRQRQPEAALESWKKVLELKPGDQESLDALARLYALLGRARELLDVLRRQLAATEEPSRRALLLLQIGTLQDEHLEDGPGALTTFRLLLKLRPDDPAALERMDRLTEKLQRWPDLAEVLSKRIQLEAGGEGADLKLRLAVLRESRLMDREGAVQLYAEILGARPGHADAVDRLAAIVERDPKNQPAAGALIRALRASGGGPRLARVLEQRVGACDADERKALLLELAQLRAAQNEPELEYLARYRAFKDDPNDSSLRDPLESAARAAGAAEELAHAYEEELPRVAEARDGADICLRLAALLEEKLGQPDRAALFYEKARELDPEADARVLPALARLYARPGKADQLAAVLATLADRSEDAREKAALLFRVGQLCQEALGDSQRAAKAYERVLELDRSHLPAAQRLEQLHEAAGDIDRLYAVLRLQRDSATGAERERILSKMAEVSAEGLSDVGQSIDLYRELLAKNPRNEQAYASLEQLLERDLRFAELADLLAGRLRQAVERRELARVNDKLGRTLLKLDRKDEAITYLKAALERDPRHKPALESLAELYQELGQKENLAAVLRRLLPLQEDGEGAKAVRLRLAELLGQMNRREEALDAGRRAMEIEPHRASDLNRVYQVFSALKAQADAVRALELRARVELESEEPDRAVATLFEISELWKGAGRKPESAGPPLLKILELDPANRTAYERARDLFAELGDWRAYAEVIDRYLPQVVTDEEKVELLRELAAVREQKLGQKDAAFLAVCRALQLNPADEGLRREVERLAEATGSHEELAAVYEQVAGELPRGPLAEGIYRALARVQDEKLDDPAGAEASLRQVLEFDPASAPALESLAQMFSRRGRDRDYVVALEQRAEATAALEERKQLLRQCARVYEERLADPGEAAGALLRALDLEPDAETFGLLVGFFKRQGAWVDAVHTLLRSRDLAGSAAERARIQIEIAQIYERELGQDADAAAAYREALELDPDNREAVDALEHLYVKLDRPAELLAIYDRQLELSSDYRQRMGVLFKSAALWEAKFQNPANADACIEGVLAIDPQNLEAIRQLERLRAAQGRWEELVGVLERHLQLCTSAEEQSALAVAIGDVFYQQLRQVDRAAKQYDRALDLNGANLDAMHALGTLYERSGNWSLSLEMLQREAEVLGASPQAAELHHRMGKINEEMLQDAAAAKACYQQALQVAPGFLPSIRALKVIHQGEGDTEAFERALIDEAQYCEHPQEKSRALADVGNYFGEQKEDLETAAQWYEQALQLDPSALEPARRLADIYVGRESWEKSERMLEIAIARMTERLAAGEEGELPGELCRQIYRSGYVAEKLGDKAKALDAYERAYQVDATYLPALEGLGHLLVQANRLEEALKVYQTILINHREDLTDLEVVEIYWQLGDLHGSLGQVDRAQSHFEKALSIDPGHEPSLRALTKLADEAGRFDKSAEYRQRLVRVLEGDAKFEVCLELGSLARTKLSEAYMAIDAYLAAHKIRPDDLAVMDALYVLYRETRQGKRAAEILERMLEIPELQQDPQRAKRVYFALGEISRDELNEVDRSVAAFNSALDLDPRFVEAFSAIESLLSAQKQWKLLEENYARMIHRLPKSDDTQVARMALWKALGELYRQVLKNPDSALMAYQVVAAGLPDDADVQEAYAELAAQKSGEEQKAVAALRRALASTPRPAKVCSALAELGARLKDYDLAYMAAQTVQAFFQDVGPGEREILTKLTPYAKRREIAQQPLSDRLWKAHLLDRRVRGPIGEVMAILFGQLGRHLAVPLSHYQVNPKKHRIDVPSAQEYHIHHYRYVARLLGMEAVELYSPFLVATRERLNKKSNEPVPEPLVGVEICQTDPVCLKIGGKFFGEPGQREVYYLLGRTLALLRAELTLSQRIAPARLEALFQAALSLSVPNFRATVDRRALEAERALLDRSLAEPARVALDHASREYIRASARTSVADYLQGVEMTASRAGLFVAGEVEAAKKMAIGETGAAYRVEVEAKLRDLIAFAVSDDLQALRTAAGNRVEVQLRR